MSVRASAGPATSPDFMVKAREAVGDPTRSRFELHDEAPLSLVDSSVQSADAAEVAVRTLLHALGKDVAGAHLADTPRRVAASMRELLTRPEFDVTTFANDEGYESLVLVRDIPFHSLCEHHLLPFHGVAHVGYLPGERLVGLSKLARAVEWFARDLQVQERLTVQIAEFLDRHLAPRGVGVVVKAEHLCMSLRGVQARGTTTTTSTFLGMLAENAELREAIARTPRAAR